jgi:hypothetical protein
MGNKYMDVPVLATGIYSHPLFFYTAVIHRPLRMGSKSPSGTAAMSPKAILK